LKSHLVFVVIKLILYTVIWSYSFIVSHVSAHWTLRWYPEAPRNFMGFSSSFIVNECISVDNKMSEIEGSSYQLQATPSWWKYPFLPQFFLGQNYTVTVREHVTHSIRNNRLCMNFT
jgi:hypothetical protein